MSDERKTARNDQLVRRTIPGWLLLGVTIFIVMTRSTVSETLVGTLLGFSVMLLGVPLAGWISGSRRKPGE